MGSSMGVSLGGYAGYGMLSTTSLINEQPTRHAEDISIRPMLEIEPEIEIGWPPPPPFTDPIPKPVLVEPISGPKPVFVEPEMPCNGSYRPQTQPIAIAPELQQKRVITPSTTKPSDKADKPTAKKSKWWTVGLCVVGIAATGGVAFWYFKAKER